MLYFFRIFIGCCFNNSIRKYFCLLFVWLECLLNWWLLAEHNVCLPLAAIYSFTFLPSFPSLALHKEWACGALFVIFHCYSSPSHTSLTSKLLLEFQFNIMTFNDIDGSVRNNSNKSNWVSKMFLCLRACGAYHNMARDLWVFQM